ncbi:MAG: alanine racemase [Acidobacteriia bacterium]|nr:alanine racemase [Terriglobia bacterium]
MIPSRRTFFKTALGMGVLSRGTRAYAASVPRDSSFDPWVEIDTPNFRHNVAEITRRVSGRPILAVIKNNGYGTGVVNVARALEPERAIAGFAVVKLHEAHALRDAGIQKPILLMGPCDEGELQDAVVRKIRPMVYTALGPALDRVSRRIRGTVPLHICVDTGIGRVGIPYRQAPGLIADLAGRKSVQVEGMMMTFTEDPEFDVEQLKRFLSLGGALEGKGLQLGKKHAASSFGLFQHADAFLDMVRPGMALFGIYSEKEFRSLGLMALRPALRLKARVLYVKQLSKGESAGYNRAYRAEHDVWVATLPVGHADGLPRAAAKGARVRIGEVLYPIIASISASHCIVEIGSEPRVHNGDIATFFDAHEGSRPEDFAASCDSSVYDLTMHLSALLPRRML